MRNQIDITGVDLVAFVKKAYELSTPQVLGFIHFKEGGLSDEDAKALINEERDTVVHMDYVNGRAVKMTVHKRNGQLMIPGRWYDHQDDQFDALLNAVGIRRDETATT